MDNKNQSNFTCHFCPYCDGMGCIGELPGMGGFNNNINFQQNCMAWDIEARRFFSQDYDSNEYKKLSVKLPSIRLAPITGGVENVGYKTEEDFYFDLINAVAKAGIPISIGDGCPDIKIQTGIRAVEAAIRKKLTKGAAVFIKPYPNEQFIERIQWSQFIAEIIGIDIDSYNILTMRNVVHLEKKDAKSICALKEASPLPFAIKGIFTTEDISLVKQVKPNIVVISNHGGRVENRIGSTASFLAEHGGELAKYCDAIWVDGGIRKIQDIKTAGLLGASEVMIGRPFISALCRGGHEAVQNEVDRLLGRL